MRLKYTGDLLPETGGDPPGEYASYAAESGSFHVILDGTDGELHVPRRGRRHDRPGSRHHSRVQQGVDEPTYSLGANFPADTPPLRVRDHRAAVLRRWHGGVLSAGGPGLPADDHQPALVVLDAGRNVGLGGRAGDDEVGLVAGSAGELTAAVSSVFVPESPSAAAASFGTSSSTSSGMLRTLMNEVASYSAPFSARKMSRPCVRTSSLR